MFFFEKPFAVNFKFILLSRNYVIKHMGHILTTILFIILLHSTGRSENVV